MRGLRAVFGSYPLSQLPQLHQETAAEVGNQNQERAPRLFIAPDKRPEVHRAPDFLRSLYEILATEPELLSEVFGVVNWNPSARRGVNLAE